MKGFRLTTPLLAGILFSATPSFANLMDFSATRDQGIDPHGQIDRLYLNSLGDHGIVISGELEIDDPSRPSNLGTRIISADDLSATYFYDEALAGNFFDLSKFFNPLDDPHIVEWIFAYAAQHRSVTYSDKYFDDATGPHGFLDSGGTIARLSNPAPGGGTVRIAINSNGQIVGLVYDRSNYDGLLSLPAASEVYEPNPMPLLAGCLPLLAIAVRRKLAKNRRTVCRSPEN